MYVGEPRDWAPTAVRLRYTAADCSEEAVDPSALAPVGDGAVHWLDVVGIHDADLIAELGRRFGAHPLVVEDILNPSNRAKYESQGDVLFVVARMLSLATGGDPPSVVSEQLSLLHRADHVLSLQEQPGDVFERVRQRIRTKAGRIRDLRADYLLHALLDAVVDGYFEVLVALEDAAEALALRAPTADPDQLVAEAQHLRAGAATVRRAALPLRDAIGRLLADDRNHVQEATLPWFRDLHEHLVQAVEVSEGVRDRLATATELCLASASHRANEAMRFLTVVASLFIPLTFVAGIYGMNFSHMPELGWRWGYPALLTVMAGMAGAMLAWFRSRRWL